MKMVWLTRVENHLGCGTFGHEAITPARSGALPLCLSYTHFTQRMPSGDTPQATLPVSEVLTVANRRSREKVIMTEFGTEPSFRTYLQIMRQRKWWVSSITVLGLAASLAFSLTRSEEYSATAQLLVQPTVYAGSVGAVQEPVTQTEVE